MGKNNNQNNHQSNGYNYDDYQNQNYNEMNYGNNNQNYNNYPNGNYENNNWNYNEYPNQNMNNTYQNSNYYDNGQYQQNGQEYYNQNYNNQEFEYEEYKEPRKKTGLLFLISFFIIGLLAISGYFGYTKYYLNSKAIVDLSQYEIEFKPYGSDGDGTAAADIKKIPTVKSDDSSVTQFLQEPSITFSKTNNLRNGEKVEVTISLSKTSAEAKKLELKGEFKRSYTVRGLNEKSKDSFRDSNSSSGIKVLREDSSIDTKELSDVQVGDWARAMYIKNYSRNSSTYDFSYDVWLGSDHLAYVNLKRNGDVVGKYRVNGRGQLEHNERGSWYVVSGTFTS
ncbi:hypothetical protein [uncultured Gemella sp.]|uniref:hypothetical protein n=1 Tax=uncultured Gemella sp. TaxID=254352 RepID=UPI0028D5C789|nr:hypothetical protein [uncultured Gemella sp.]